MIINKGRPMNFYPIPFRDLTIGQEFWWGGYNESNMNWGRKRSSRTGDYRPKLCGQLSDHVDWAYWGQNETVYLLK